MAYLSPKERTIYIDQNVLEICKSFGKDSSNTLAFLLGHELTHHYMQHRMTITSQVHLAFERIGATTSTIKVSSL